MKQNSKLYEYLRSKGVLEHGTKKQIAQAKKEFWRFQDKERLKAFRKSSHRKDVYLTEREFEVLAAAAKRHGMKLGTFIRLAAMAYVKTEYLLPSDNAVHELEVSLRRIGNNINQLTKHVHQRGFTPDDLVAFQQKLNELETQVSQFLRQPLPLAEFLKNLLLQKPEYADTLEQVLLDFRKK